MDGNINVREGGEQRRHEERMAMRARLLESLETDHKLREREIALREKELNLSVRRDLRERWLFLVAFASLFVSGGSLYVAAWVLKVASLPKPFP